MVDMGEASKQKSEDTGHLWQNGQDQDTVLRVWACLTGGHIGTFTVSFGLILLILFSFLMALFFDWKVVRVLMVVGLSSPLSKSSFILFYSWCFCTPKAR